MKPLTPEEIERLKVWAEKQRQRRPNDILYEDIGRLIATIENQQKSDERARVHYQVNQVSFRVWQRWTCARCGRFIQATIETTVFEDYEDLAKTNFCCPGCGHKIPFSESQNSSQGESEQKEVPSKQPSENWNQPCRACGERKADHWIRESDQAFVCAPGINLFQGDSDERT